jgi:hypothetical protein
MSTKSSHDFQQNTAFPALGFCGTINSDFLSSFRGNLQTTKDSFAQEVIAGKATCNGDSAPGAASITANQSDRWNERFQELRPFKQEYGNCCVPSHWPKNEHLAKWVKHQRYPYKLKNEGQYSTMTEEREKLLKWLDFVWGSHSVLSEEHLHELYAFHNIPTAYPENPQLAIWVKVQRRQCKLLYRGRRQPFEPDLGTDKEAR